MIQIAACERAFKLQRRRRPFRFWVLLDKNNLTYVKSTTNSVY